MAKTRPVPNETALSIEGSDDRPDRVDRVEEAWRRERPDIDASSIGIVSRVWRIGRHLQRHRKTRLEALGTDTVTLDVLAMLRRSGPPYRRTAGELMQSALISSGGVSQRLEKLEKAGYVTRHVSLEDRRRVEVQLTPSGVELVDKVVADVMENEAKLLARLTGPEQHELRRLLKKLLSEFE